MRRAARPCDHRALRGVALAAVALLTFCSAAADQKAVSVLADFNDNSVAANLGEIRNAAPTDCSLTAERIPARSGSSLSLLIGAVAPEASVTTNLRFRSATRFRSIDSIAVWCWSNDAAVRVSFRLQDANGSLFETPGVVVRKQPLFVRVQSPVEPSKLKRVASPSPEAGQRDFTWPIEVAGIRVETLSSGRTTVFFDDLEVEHLVADANIILGSFRFDHATQIYEPGANIAATLVLENTSPTLPLSLSVETSWIRADGSTTAGPRQNTTLQPRGADYRSRSEVAVNERIAEPGLYRLAARVTGPALRGTREFETTVAVAPSNRNLSRGRSVFFGVRANFLEEPLDDLLLEIEAAREIGAQLVAVETPWSELEPKSGTMRFGALDRVVAELVNRNIAVMVVFVRPPEWLDLNGPTLPEQAARLLEALLGHFGDKVRLFQFDLPASGDGPAPLSDPAVVGQLQQRLEKARPGARLIPPSRANSDPAVSSTVQPAGLCLETEGDSTLALGALHELVNAQADRWSEKDWWLHRAEPLPGPGHLYDAVGVLRQYVFAARSGFGSLLWFDLRDDSNDSRFPEMCRGLMRRDFSPRTTLSGFASAAGMLNGLAYSGPLPGTPEGYDSALFIGSKHQVGVLLPKPNRVLPAIFMPLQGVAGELTVYDFERRAVPALTSPTKSPIFVALSRPQFISLALQSAQPAAQVAVLARPWVRVPGTVFCGTDSSFTIEIDPPVELGRGSFLRLRLPDGAPVQPSVTTKVLQGPAGQTLSESVQLRPKGAADFQPFAMDLRITIEGRNLEFPIMVRPIVDIAPLGADSSLAIKQHKIGELAPQQTDSPTAKSARSIPLLAAYDKDRLVLEVALPGDAQPGDELRIGAAAEGAAIHREVRITGWDATPPKIAATFGSVAAPDAGWRSTVTASGADKSRVCRIEAPAADFAGAASLRAGHRLLLAVRWVREPGTGKPDLSWGGGLEGSRSSAEFHWVRLSGDAP